MLFLYSFSTLVKYPSSPHNSSMNSQLIIFNFSCSSFGTIFINASINSSGCLSNISFKAFLPKPSTSSLNNKDVLLNNSGLTLKKYANITEFICLFIILSFLFSKYGAFILPDMIFSGLL